VETTGFGPATPFVQGSAVVGEQQGRYLRERQEAYLRGVGDVAKSRNRTPFSGMIVPALYAKENGMLLAYLDDSGELGIVLFATVIVPDRRWLPLLDAWIDYRRWLRSNFGFPMFKGRRRRVPVELHATDFATGAGDWRGLKVNQQARMRALRVGLRLIGRYANVFAVAWVPSRPMSQSYVRFHESPAIDCWRTVLERLATYSTSSANGAPVLALLDQGYGDQFTRVLRKMRRYHRVGSLYGGTHTAPAPMLIDDPILRNSKENAFIQMADLCAYAALRELRPVGVASNLWGELGAGVVRAVNKYQPKQPPGIKLLPP